MRHFIVSLTLTTAVLMSANAQAAAPHSPIQWDSQPSSGVEKAQQLKKPVLLYFTTSWCHYCKKLDQSTWTNSGVVEEINENFVPVKVDGDVHKQLAQALGVRGFPTTVMISPEGKELHRVVGYVSAPLMVTHLTTASLNAAKVAETSTVRPVSLQ